MARPAGYSSDEDFSDDDGFSSPRPFYVSPRNNLEANNHFLPLGQGLIMALINKDKSAAAKLIQEGADVNFKSHTTGGWTALMHACSTGSKDLIKLLLEHGANPSDHHQLVTPLMCVCDSSSIDEPQLIECIELLLQYGADLNAVDWCNTGVLIYAVKRNHEKVVLKLIHLGCDVDKADTDGWTSLFYAVDTGRLNMVQILKDAGASIEKVDQKGRSVHDIAVSKYYKEIAELVNTTEKNVEIDEILDNNMGYRKRSSYSYVLSELPKRKYGRFHGFHSDTTKWISGIYLSHLNNLFLKKNIQLGQLLTMSDEELKNIGVSYSFDRKKIKFCVQKLLEHNWGKNCIRAPGDDEVVDLNVAAQIICNMVRQVYVISAATYTWKIKDGVQLTRNREQYIDKGLYHTKLFKKELNIILKLAREIEEDENITPADLILPKKLRKYSFRKLILFSLGFLCVQFVVSRTLKQPFKKMFIPFC